MAFGAPSSMLWLTLSPAMKLKPTLGGMHQTSLQTNCINAAPCLDGALEHTLSSHSTMFCALRAARPALFSQRGDLRMYCRLFCADASCISDSICDWIGVTMLSDALYFSTDPAAKVPFHISLFLSTMLPTLQKIQWLCPLLPDLPCSRTSPFSSFSNNDQTTI